MNDSCNGQILIACIGNVFLGDDGFGVEMARRLKVAELQAEAKVVDYGIRGLDLAYALLKPWRAVIVVDAVSRGGAPGDLYVLEPVEDAEHQSGLDPHSMDPISVLAAARSLGNVSAPVYIFGCEPLDCGDELEGRMGLSPEVTFAIPKAVAMVQKLVAELATVGILTRSAK